MADIEVLLPKMGESVAEATIVKWLKNEGDAIDADESIIEIATDKVDSEVPAPSEGVLIKKLVDEGDVVAVGQVIAVIGSEATKDESSAPSPVELKDNDAPISSNDAATNGVSEQIEEALMASVPPMETNGAIAKSDDSGRFYSPLVRSIAKKEGIL
ncbi:MAG: 2-oxo acid dehydrogenase subunit E2, partial [Flavobacteriales bacterium]|nr:2-oxo acid dehydrogenase subunit E2 [Flavobacteriales bacterium]